MIKRFFLCFFSVFMLMGSSAFSEAPKTMLPLPPSIKAIMDEPQFASSRFGLYVKDLTTNQDIYKIDTDKYFIPASVSKLFSMTALLSELGYDYTFKTPVYAMGQKNELGVFKGNLILVGQGDLVFGGRLSRDHHIAFTNLDHTYANIVPDFSEPILTEEDPLAAFQALAKQIKASGIKQIEGNVIIDDRAFETTMKRDAVLSPVLVNENQIDVVVKPSQLGKPAFIVLRPFVSDTVVVNQTMTVADDAVSSLEIIPNENGRAITVRGNISIRKPSMTYTTPILHPNKLARMALLDALQKEGVQVYLRDEENETLPNESDYKSLKPVAEYRSLPLIEYAKLVLKVSHNIGANLTPLLLAKKYNKKTYAEGMVELNRFFTDTAHILKPNDISFGDAAGGNDNYVTPNSVMNILEYNFRQPKEKFAAFRNALPIMGEMGSLHAAKNSPAQGRVFAKTGTGIILNMLRNNFFVTSDALAGYYQGKDGHWYGFVVVVNNLPIETILDDLKISAKIADIASQLYVQANTKSRAPER